MSLATLLDSGAAGERARRLRRAMPIHFYGGRNGSGKSLCAVFDSMPDLDAGRHVLSTVRITDYRDPRPCEDEHCSDDRHGMAGHLAAHPLWIPFTDWPQLLDFRHGSVIMDEIVGVADSAETASIPPVVRRKFQELRRHEVQLRITGLNWIRVHKRIREACRAVTRCDSFMPVRGAVDENGEELIWPMRKLAIWRTYDARSLPVDDHSDTAYENADLLAKARHWIPTSPALNAYDTFSAVTTVGEISDAGRCATCAGTRRVPACSCPEYVEKLATGRPARKARSAEDGPVVVPLNGAGVRGGRVR